jgi:queuine/archaeosine tRNA-ribosyltransferase
MKTYIGWVHGLRPWKEHNWASDLQGLCVNYYEFKKRPKALEMIHSDGIRSYLDFKGEILLDSGAYPAWKSGVSLSVVELAHFYKMIETYEPDISKVNLDVLGDGASEERSWKNYCYLRDQGLVVLPVIHVDESVHGYPDSTWIGIGGAVPVIRTLSGKRRFLQFVMSLKKERRCKVHIFGVAGPTMIPALRTLGVDSGDWMGWRISASMGSIQLPTRQVHITTRTADKWSKNIRENEITEFIDPSPFSLRDLKADFATRALFNLWIYQECARGRFSISNKWTNMASEIIAATS